MNVINVLLDNVKGQIKEKYFVYNDVQMRWMAKEKKKYKKKMKTMNQ